MDKYDINFSNEVKQQDLQRLTNQLWKLLPMRENNENWEEHLKTIVEEISGLVKIYKDDVNGLVLLSKLEGLTSEVCKDFMVYRTAVFRCINLLGQVLKHE